VSKWIAELQASIPIVRATENAGHENVAQAKMQGWKCSTRLQGWKMRDMENAVF